jgi:hypothetical protein
LSAFQLVSISAGQHFSLLPLRLMPGHALRNGRIAHGVFANT